MAGLAVAAVAIPSAIAYPAIAGLPPQTGVYSSIFALVGYALLGPSRQLIVGPDAPTMTVLAAALANVSANAPDDRVAAAAAVALAVGVFCLFASRLHLGVVAAFPVEADPRRLHQRGLDFNPGRTDRASDRPADRIRGPCRPCRGALPESWVDSPGCRSPSDWRHSPCSRSWRRCVRRFRDPSRSSSLRS